MLKIRFQRTGRKNDPAFRVVVGEHTAHPTSGKHLAILGSHHPKTKHTVLDGDAIKHWIAKGAQVSGTVHNLLVEKKIIDGKKVNVLPKKTPIVKEEEVKEEAPAAEASSDAPEAPAEAPAEETPVEEKTEEAPAPEAEATEEKPAE